jgi:hypothetical protein
MTRSQREALVEHYLTGEMSAAEEQEFFMTVAVDGELLGTLRAHRQVERALRRDRDALPSGYAAVQERALAMLAVQPQVSPISNARRWFSGSRFSNWITTASTALVFAVAGYAGRDMISEPKPDAVPPIHSVATTSQQTGKPQSGIPMTITPHRDSVVESATPAMHSPQESAREEATTPARATPSERPLRASNAAAREAAVENNRRRHGDTSVVRERRQAKAATPPEVTPSTVVEDDASAPIRPSEDEVRFKVKVKVPRLQNPKEE